MTDRGVAVDAGRIKYATENFQQLQGLGMSALGAWVTMIVLALHFKLRGLWWVPVISLTGLAIWAYRIDYFPRYYQRRFGSVEQKSVSSEPLVFRLVWGFVPGFAVLMSFVGAHQAAKVLLLIVSLVSAVALRNWRPRETFLDPRTNYFLPAILSVVWIYGYPMWHTLDAKHAALWETLGVLAVPVLFLVTGLCDHVLLLRLMPKRVSEDEGGERDD